MGEVELLIIKKTNSGIVDACRAFEEKVFNPDYGSDFSTVIPPVKGSRTSTVIC